MAFKLYKEGYPVAEIKEKVEKAFE